MKRKKYSFELTPGIKLDGKSFILIAGPCAVESFETTFETAYKIKKIAQSLNIPFIFKSSFDKANRTSYKSFRGLGLDKALNIFSRIKEELNVPILTDVHEANQIKKVASVVDVLQIPAFLCRQTDLIQEAGKTGLSINIKRGQFLAPQDMVHVVEKVHAVGNKKTIITERGFSFGYNNLVVDFRSLPIMRNFSPVIFDVTHSLQLPGGLKDKTGGQKEFAPYLAKAAVAVGVDGLFMEVHPEPSKALSDSSTQISIDELKFFLQNIQKLINI